MRRLKFYKVKCLLVALMMMLSLSASVFADEAKEYTIISFDDLVKIYGDDITFIYPDSECDDNLRSGTMLCGATGGVLYVMAIGVCTNSHHFACTTEYYNVYECRARYLMQPICNGLVAVYSHKIIGCLLG